MIFYQAEVYKNMKIDHNTSLRPHIHQQTYVQLLASIRCYKCGKQCRRLFSPPGDDDGVVNVKLAGSQCTVRILVFHEFGYTLLTIYLYVNYINDCQCQRYQVRCAILANDINLSGVLSQSDFWIAGVGALHVTYRSRTFRSLVLDKDYQVQRWSTCWCL